MEAYSWDGNYKQFRRVIDMPAESSSVTYLRTEAVLAALETEKAIDNSHSLNTEDVEINIDQPLNGIIRDVIKLLLKRDGMTKTKASEQLNICRTFPFLSFDNKNSMQPFGGSEKFFRPPDQVKEKAAERRSNILNPNGLHIKKKRAYPARLFFIQTSTRGFEPPTPRLGGVCSILLSYVDLCLKKKFSSLNNYIRLSIFLSPVNLIRRKTENGENGYCQKPKISLRRLCVHLKKTHFPAAR